MNITLQKTNKVVLITNWFLDLFLLLGYVIEFAKGNKSLSYVLFFLTILLIPMVTAQITYFKKKDSESIKYITIVGFFVIYTFAMFTTERTLVFVYIIPIILNYLLYYNLKLIKYSVSLIVLLNTARVIYFVAYLGHNDKNITTDYTIQMACVILVSVALYVTTKLSNQFHDEKMITIDNDQKRKEEVAINIKNQVTSLFDLVDNQNSLIVNFNDKLNDQATSFEMMKTSLDKLLDKSGSIKSITSNQSKGNATIENSIKDFQGVQETTKENLLLTFEDIAGALQKANTLEDMLLKVENSVSNIKDQSDKIKNTIQIVVDIAEKINLLSLNASIEAARAGESGRGFAVVADEIGKLATQTSESINDINKVLTLSSAATDEGVSVINDTSVLIKDTMQSIRGNSKKIDSLQESIQVEEKHINSIIEEIKKNIILGYEIGEATDDQEKSVEASADLIALLKTALEEMVGEMGTLSTISSEIHNNANDVLISTDK